MILFNPVELIKCRAQVNRETYIVYSEYVPNIIRNEGFFALYNGALCQMGRDVPAWAFYFWSYAAFKDYF